MSECDNPQRRNGDRSRMSALANSAAVTLASRGALILVVGIIAFTAQRSLSTLDKIAVDVDSLSTSMAVVSNQLGDHARRIEKVENKVFR